MAGWTDKVVTKKAANWLPFFAGIPRLVPKNAPKELFQANKII
jgi:hypothetical protein